MNKSEILALFDYNYWANERVLSAAARVTPAQFIARRASATELARRARSHPGRGSGLANALPERHFA
jgi:uncharacterized damage-inducible protein DinB